MEQTPTVRMNRDNRGETHGHPAFGTITMTIPQCGSDRTLFGSDIGHGHLVRIQINRAEIVRDLSSDWIHQRDALIDIEMSHAQFAQFITSAGNGNGTPVTLRWIEGEGYVPKIKKAETKHETQRREIADAAKRRLTAIRVEIAALGALIESGKVGKTELRRVQKELLRHVDQLPDSMQFVVGQAEDALEKAASDAKIEVESYIQATAQRLGLRQISDLSRLENRNVPSLRYEGEVKNEDN